MTLTVLHHPACQEHDLPEGSASGSHVEQPARLEAFRAGLHRVEEALTWRQAPLCTTDTLGTLHTPDHVRRVETSCHRGGFLDSDTYARPESWDAARAAVGAAIETARLALDGTPAISMTRPPGHHATPSDAMGFCLFNNVALAAHALTKEHARVAIVDIDVHHGNGTQDAFYTRDDVLYISLHQSPFYPGTGLSHETGKDAGEGTTVNLPVPQGTGHAGWLELLDRVVVPIVEAFEADALLVSAGYDAHRKDPIGGLELVSRTYHAAFARLAEANPNLGVVLEGGYSLEALEDMAHVTASALLGKPDPIKEPLTEGVRPWGMLRSAVETYHAPRWPVDAPR